MNNNIFLEEPPDRGLPTEYLLSRTMGRRSHLVRDWNALVPDPQAAIALLKSRYAGLSYENASEAVWTGLVKEYRWIYTRMDRRTRAIFRPFFLYSELRTLFICLRHLKAKKVNVPGDLLSASLLHKSVKKTLMLNEGLLPAIAEIEHALLKLTGDAAGIARLVQEKGLREAEQRITSACLLYIMKSRLDPVIRRFFGMIIDARNVTNIYKFIRLSAKQTPFILQGGSVPMKRLTNVLEKNDLTMVPELIREVFGIGIETPDTASIEGALYRGITKILRKGASDPLSFGPMLYYLWRCSIEAVNLGLVLRGGLDREIIMREMIQ